MTGKDRITQGDAARCVRVLKQNGFHVSELEIRRPDGSSTIVRVPRDANADADTLEDEDPIMRMIDEASRELEERT